jgi:hypothetical protein
MNKKETSSRGALSASQHHAIKLLASGCTARYAALVLKLDYADVRRWMSKNLAFQNELAAQVEKRSLQSSETVSSRQEKKIRDKSRRGDYESDETSKELA